MVKTLNITTANYQGGNTFKYPIRGSMNCPKDISHVAVTGLKVYNNSFNITSSYGNNTLIINWLGTNYTITFPNGYYSVSDINSYLQAFCYTNNLYMTSSSGSIVYFVELSAIAVRYVISYYIPSRICCRLVLVGVYLQIIPHQQ